MLTHALAQADGDIGIADQRQQQLWLNGLDVTGFAGKQWHSPLRSTRGGFLNRCYGLFGDDSAGIALNSAIDGVDLNGVRQVVREVDHHAETHEEQKDRHADGESGIDLRTSAASKPTVNRPPAL